jgi:serine/threonine-protein kinase
MIEAGTSVEGYRVERMIGRGGMGVVYEAVQVSLGRRVALKVLRPELAEDPGFVERFRREARLQAALEHPNVLDVYEAGESEQGLFLAMRLVSGRTLLDLLHDGELDAERALALLDRVAGALDAAHAAGLVHRDVKPQNVLLGEGDQAFLADFGLTQGGAETVASSRPVLGSLAYVAPEIVRGEEPTPASDRYSLGVTLFHCLTGDVPFPRGSDAAVLYAHATEKAPRAGERRPELPGELDEVLGAALAKQPEERPGSAREIVDAARRALSDRISTLGSPTRGEVPARAPGEPDPPPAAAKGRRVSLKVAVGIGLVVGAAALGGAALALGGDGDGEEVPLAALPQGAEALGSALDAPERSLDCRGRAPTPGSPACSIVQTDLPGRTVLVPADGAIVGWAVRGAKGELALDVVRPRGSDTVRVVRSQWESAGNPGPHHFATRLPVEAGDRIGVQLGRGASIGVSETAGASTERWLAPTGGAYGLPDRGSGTGFDYEVALRAEFVPGAQVALPRHLTGAAAARAPDGTVRKRATLTVDKPRPVRLTVELVEVGGRVTLDVLRDGRRTLRVFAPGLRPGGSPIELQTVHYPGASNGEAGVWWVNPSSGRSSFHYFAVAEGKLVSAG